MSSSKMEGRFDVSWEEIRSSQAEDLLETFPSKDDQTAAEGGEIQEKDMMGVEAENIAERHKESTPNSNDIAAPVTGNFTPRHMNAISKHPDASEVNTITTSENKPVANVELEFDNGQTGVSDVDVGAVEKEDVTGIVNSIDGMITNLDKVEKVTAETNPDRNVRFKRQGHTTSMTIRGSGKQYDWKKSEAGEHPSSEMLSGHPRYHAFNDTFDGVGQVAGTGSIQVTMRPKIYEEHENKPDKWVRDFSGSGEKIGMHALSPLIYGLFQNSPVIDEISSDDGSEDQDFRKVIETLNGRDKAYGQGFQNEHDSKGLGKNEAEYITENSKAAYSPELAQIENIKDQVEFPANSKWTFSAPTKAGKMKVVDKGEAYDPEKEYKTLDESTFLKEDDEASIRVGHQDWDLPGNQNVIKTKEFPKHEKFQGKVYIEDEDGNVDDKRVVVDYQDEDIFPEMDEQKFKETAKGHYNADATSVWYPWRMRPDMPAVEYRDMGNNPFRNAGIATQVGAFRRWREIQDFAQQELGLKESDAKHLRLGINGMSADHENNTDYLKNTGMDYTINSEKNITLQDAWLGSNLESGLLDIISEGVEEMTNESADAYSVEEYRETMGSLLENGLTPGEMMAKEHGADIDGDVLYNPEDKYIGGAQRSI